MKKHLLLWATALVAFSSLSKADVWYVHQHANGTSTGMDWINAYTDLQSALAVAASGDTIFVGAGTYLPSVAADLTSRNPRDVAFVLKEGVHIFGGFKGSETSLDQRASDSASIHVTNATILSGDLRTSGDSSDNAYHVVIAADITVFTLDGFTIAHGYADGTGTINVNGTSIERRGGAGIYNSNATGYYRNLVVKNNRAKSDADEFGGGGGVYNHQGTLNFTRCAFVSNHAEKSNGGGMKNFSSSPEISDCYFGFNTSVSDDEGAGGLNNKTGSNPILTHVVFQGNVTNGSGGGIYNDQSSPRLEQVAFISNRAGNCGGGMDTDGQSNAVLNNVVFIANHASEDGGGLYGWQSSATLTNVRFIDNHADRNGGGMYNYNTCHPTLTNVTFSGNTADNHYGGFGLERNSTATLTNVLFSRNRAVNNGGGLGAHDNHGTHATIITTNITVANNTAKNGGGGYDQGTTSQLRNSIIAGNYPDDADVNAALVIASRYNIVGIGSGLSYIENGSVNPTGVAVNWPLFEDTSTSNYKLISTSPAIDAGDSAFYNAGATPNLSSIVADLRGADRTMGAQTDLGAYEVCDHSLMPSVTITTSLQDPWAMWYESVTFTAVPVNGGPNPVFQWEKNGVAIPGAPSTAVWEAVAWVDFRSEDSISVNMVSSAPCADPASVTSSKIAVEVIPESVTSITGNGGNIRLYPNPNDGRFLLQGLIANQQNTITVTDATGRTVYQKAAHPVAGTTQSQVVLPDMMPGIYFLSVSSGQKPMQTVRFAIW